MQIVIDIPDKDYENCKMLAETIGEVLIHHSPSDRIKYFVGVGTPLPKGHGRIMDVDRVIKKMEEREERLKDDRSMYETSCVETALDMFGETIIEADEAESEVANESNTNNRIK